jgi:Tfp pilus assembly protein PilX
MRHEHLASERGIALIVVLLLMAVLSGLATGFALTGQMEVQMGTNEVYFAGARAAAEGGLNRALAKVLDDTSTNWIAGSDNAVDASNAAAAVNADNGSLTFKLGAGPFYVDTANRYSFTVRILDDDDDSLYETPLTAAQVTTMGEDDSAYTSINDRVILQATGFGPNGTVVKLARIIESVDTLHTTTTTTSTLANPAILVNGNFEMNGTIRVTGSSGSVHANGNLSKTGTGSGVVTGSATASGTTDLGGWTAIGATGGGRPTINVPDIRAQDYMNLADYKLTSSGTVETFVSGAWTTCTSGCPTGWSYNSTSGTWSSGNDPSSATYYVEGNVDIGPTGGSANKVISVIATGDINVSSSAARLQPENSERIQFVCDGDLEINASDLTATALIEGQIMVRGQFEADGSMEYQGRVMVQDVAGAGSLIADGLNKISGSVNFAYNGTLGAITTVLTTTSSAPTTYVNNVSGWMEQ